jgi:hypothetical protein
MIQDSPSQGGNLDSSNPQASTNFQRSPNSQSSANSQPPTNPPISRRAPSRPEVIDPELRPDQQQALELLVAGKTVTESAATVGVSRLTIYRWLKDDANFKAAYHQWHEQLQRSSRTRLLMLTEKATLAVEKALDAGDAKTAMQLLRGMGILKDIPPGSTDPAEIRRRLQLEEKRKELDLREEAAVLKADEILLDMGIVGAGMRGGKKRRNASHER